MRPPNLRMMTLASPPRRRRPRRARPGAAAPAAAEKLSDRPISIVAPFTPGTGIDILARVVGEELHRAGTSRS